MFYYKEHIFRRKDVIDPFFLLSSSIIVSICIVKKLSHVAKSFANSTLDLNRIVYLLNLIISILEGEKEKYFPRYLFKKEI